MDKEKKEDFKVSDKRRFVVGENGTVQPREEDEAKTHPAADAQPSAAEPPKAGPSERTGNVTDEELKASQDYSGPCDEDFSNLPPINFTSFVFSLSTSTMIYLGLMPEPTSGKMMKNLALAKQHIDILGMLQEKTAGNLDPAEEKFIKNSLYDLRMQFVNACDKSSQS